MPEPGIRPAERTAPAPGGERALVERLGYDADDVLLIVTCDDVGINRATNGAVVDALENGLATSGSIMVPTPCFEEIAAWARDHPEADLGLHLTFTCEWSRGRWGPVAPREEVPGLVDPTGHLWPTIWQVYLRSSPREAELEARAQVERALAAGIDVTHLTCHMALLQYSDRFFRVLHRLARDYDVPLRMASPSTLERFGLAHQRCALDADGIVCPDVLWYGERAEGEPVAELYPRLVRALAPGVNELFLHPALPTAEMRRLTGSWRERAEEHALFTHDAGLRELVASRGIRLVGYRELRDLQRRVRRDGRAPSRAFAAAPPPQPVVGEDGALRWSVRLSAPAECVWRALTKARVLARWLGSVDVDVESGGSFALRFEPMPDWDGRVCCRVLELERPVRLAYAWSVPAAGGAESVVRWQLRAAGDETELTLEHAGIAGVWGGVVCAFMRQIWSGALGVRLPRTVASLAATEGREDAVDAGDEALVRR